MSIANIFIVRHLNILALSLPIGHTLKCDYDDHSGTVDTGIAACPPLTVQTFKHHIIVDKMLMMVTMMMRQSVVCDTVQFTLHIMIT